ncbi:NAD(P)/FAD-dependent oxidoreductase [Candidatus Harpocratesius sp.]
MQDFDIAVIGAGPGGSIAAKVAADKGYSTVILEKEDLSQNGRYKACGGAVAWELIEKLHYPEDQIDRIIENLTLHHIDGSRFTKKGKGAVLWRNKLDFFITKMALASGSELFSNEPLQFIKKEDNHYIIRTPHQHIVAKYVIAADGVTSPTLHFLDWPNFSPNDVVLTITQEMESTPQKIESSLGKEEVHLFFGIKNFIPLGYAWLFPKNKTITVGWGNSLAKIKNSRVEFQKFIRLPFTKQALSGAKKIRYTPHLIPVGTRSTIYRDSVFAVGDVAGFVDPISGKGIPYAMMSAEIAIKTIHYCEKKGKEEKMGDIYQNRLNGAFLTVLQKKREFRPKIFQNDKSLKNFLALWQKHRSSKIIMQNLLS